MAHLACLKSFFLYGVDIEAKEAPGGELMNNPRIQEETNYLVHTIKLLRSKKKKKSSLKDLRQNPRCIMY